MSENDVLCFFKKQLIKNPHNPAIISDAGVITYSELNHKSNIVAAYLQQHKIDKGDLVPVLANRSINLIIAILGIVKSGAAYVPIDNRYPEKRKEYIIQQCSTPLVLTTENEAPQLAGQTIKTIDELLANTNLIATNVTINPTDTVYVIFTSGTTGIPKGVMIEHHSLSHLIQWHNHHFSMVNNSRSTLMAGVGFDVSQWEIWSTLAAGATIYLMDEDIRLNSTDLLEFYAKNKLTHVFIPTVMVYDLISQQQPHDLALQYLFTAGEKLNPVEVDCLPYTLVDYYGPTETTIYATYRIVESKHLNKPASIGKPIAGYKIFILNEQLQEAPKGEIAELCIAGECLARGYLNNPQLTAERFIDSKILNCRIYRTGDLARILPDENIQFLGRKDDQVKIRGNRIELGEIENSLLNNPAIKATIVLVDDHINPMDKRLVAFIVPRETQTPQDELITNLKYDLRNELPDYMLPSRYICLTELPTNANGKIDKVALHKILENYTESSIEDKFADPLEKDIAIIWSKLLGHNDFTPNDSFFDIGGHSLLAMQIITDIKTQLNLTAYIRDIYENTSIQQLANQLKKRLNKTTPTSQNEPISELQNDVKLLPDTDFSTGFSTTQLTQPQHIFLTGATGFIGIHLLMELLNTTSAFIHCVIRGKNAELTLSRLQQVAKRYQVNIPKEVWQRVYVYAGDLAEPNFKLTEQQYKKLSETIDIIYHSASAVNFIQPYTYMKKDNVEGLQQIIAFAANIRVKPLILLSTISVYSWGHLHTGKTMMYENDDIDQNLPAVATDIGYVRSKWVMEKIADLAASKGLPLMTFRLGYATCHSRTGMFANYQWWGRLIKTCLTHQAMPNLDNLREGLTTVDYMVESIAAISRMPDALGKKFNLIASPEKNLTLKNFFQLLEDYFGFKFKVMPFPNWVALWENNRDAPLYPLLSMYKDVMYDNQCVIELYQNTYKWDCSNVQQYLANTSIQEPIFDKNLLKVYMENIYKLK